MPRFSFFNAERGRRSQLAQMAPARRFLRGTLSSRHGRCGKARTFLGGGVMAAET
jgi:hypothetical protein